MKNTTKGLLLTLAFSLLSPCGAAAEGDFYHYKQLPELQRQFINTRYQAYFCYNMCTFKNEKDDTAHHGRCLGNEAVSLYHPRGLDTDQWAQVCKDARMAGGWLITKHHGGFCIWDSNFTEYDVGSAKDKRDVVGAFVKSFRKAGLKVGLYYSILDYHHKVDPGKVSMKDLEFTKNQIRELLTNYGPIDYINFDAWSTWPTTIDFDDIYYKEILDLVKSIQPNCLIISHTYESNLAHAEVPFADAANRDYPYHPDYMRPVAASDFLQCDWWWDQNAKPKSAKYVLHKLNSYNSHNAVYILNVSPNPEGRIDEDAIAVLKEAAAQWQRPADIKKAAANWGYNYNVNKNKAFMMPAEQSSTADFVRDKRSYPRAEIAVDGVTEGCSAMEQTCITKDEQNPWWRVRLEESSPIKSITIYNSEDLGLERQDLCIEILDAGGKVVWSEKKKGLSRGSKLELKPANVQGMFIKIKLEGKGQLSLAEVIVE